MGTRMIFYAFLFSAWNTCIIYHLEMKKPLADASHHRGNVHGSETARGGRPPLSEALIFVSTFDGRSHLPSANGHLAPQHSLGEQGAGPSSLFSGGSLSAGKQDSGNVGPSHHSWVTNSHEAGILAVKKNQTVPTTSKSRETKPAAGRHGGSISANPCLHFASISILTRSGISGYFPFPFSLKAKQV